LQALKRGIVELADIVVINKADIDPTAAERAQYQFAGALSMLRSSSPPWRPTVLMVSALHKTGINDFWTEIERFRKVMTESAALEAKRQRQAIDWMWALIDSSLRSRFRNHLHVRGNLESLSRAVIAGQVTPAAAARQLLGYAETP
jgi:LAO/AO transport system kinase